MVKAKKEEINVDFIFRDYLVSTETEIKVINYNYLGPKEIVTLLSLLPEKGVTPVRKTSSFPHLRNLFFLKLLKQNLNIKCYVDLWYFEKQRLKCIVLRM